MKYKAISIREQGLRAKLDSPDELKKHRGFGYKVWRELRETPINKTALGIVFNVSDDTIRKWIEIDEEEQKADKNG